MMLTVTCRAPASRLEAPGCDSQLRKLPGSCCWASHAFCLGPESAGQAVCSIGVLCSQAGSSRDYVSALGASGLGIRAQTVASQVRTCRGCLQSNDCSCSRI